MSKLKEEVMHLLSKGVKQIDIARVLGCSTAYVNKVYRFANPERDFQYLVEAAKTRGMTRSALVKKLIHVIERDQLVSAILDDGVDD